MATRYLAVVARAGRLPEERLVQIQQRTGFERLSPADGLSIFMNMDGHRVIMPNGGGLIVGTMFTREISPKRVLSFSTHEADHVREGEGLPLIKRFWGGYVAFVKACQGRTLFILRDPTGAMPCYHLEVEGASIFSSDLDLLVDSGLLNPIIDWTFLPSHLYYSDLRTPRTAIVGVGELLAGTRFSTSNWGERTTSIWSPWDYVEDARMRPGEASTAVRDTANACVKAWASCFRKVLVGVSGGLDSSIVASGLQAQATPWACMTMVTEEPDGDERNYARILTEAMNQPLIEAFHKLEHIDLAIATTAHLPRPIGFLFGQSQEHTRLALLEAHGADAFFTGQGGDNVFCFLRSTTPLVDRLMKRGPGLDAYSTLIDLARLTGSSVPEILATAAKRALRRDQGYHWRGEGQFLTQKVAPPSFPHPWLQIPRHALGGKAVHISLLLRIQGTLDGFPRDTPPLVTPLLSQPLIELCLSLPTWQWCAGGVDRSLARRGFRGHLPDALLDRRSKGGPNSFSVQVIETHRKALRSHLLGGVLAAHDLLDAMAIETTLADDAVIRSPDHLRLLALAEAEAWARHWLSRRADSPPLGGRPAIVTGDPSVRPPSMISRDDQPPAPQSTRELF